MFNLFALEHAPRCHSSEVMKLEYSHRNQVFSSVNEQLGNIPSIFLRKQSSAVKGEVRARLFSKSRRIRTSNYLWVPQCKNAIIIVRNELRVFEIWPFQLSLSWL
jgi:hypothetical protein